MKDIFILPADRRSPSGGNLYNRSLLQALKSRGFTFSISTVEALLDSAPGAPAAPARYWIDSLHLEHADGLFAKLPPPNQRFFLLHYFPSLQPAEKNARKRAWRRIEDKTFASMDGFVVTSEFSRLELFRRGFKAMPVLVLPPAPTFKARRKIRKDSAMFRGLMVCNLIPGKGVLDFLKHFEEYTSGKTGFSLEIVGRLDLDKPFADACLALVAANPNLKHSVKFLGPLGLSELKNVYARNDFFISASRMETFGMALQEARLSGLHLLILRGGNAENHIGKVEDGVCFSTMKQLALHTARLVHDKQWREIISAPKIIARPEIPSWTEAARIFHRFVQQA